MTAATANTTTDATLGALPEWDLADLYPATDSAELSADLEKAARESRAFSDRYKGKLAGLSGDALGAAIVKYKEIDEIMGRIMSYAQLVYAGNAPRVASVVVLAVAAVMYGSLWLPTI